MLRQKLCFDSGKKKNSLSAKPEKRRKKRCNREKRNTRETWLID